jgi:hypothetical protein
MVPPAPNWPSTATVLIGIVQCALLAALCLAVLVCTFEVRELNSKVYELDRGVANLEREVGQIRGSSVLQLDAVKMQGSSTWTLPVSSISWSGR